MRFDLSDSTPLGGASHVFLPVQGAAPLEIGKIQLVAGTISNQLGYATQGFETFHVDAPDTFRVETDTARLDNVYFKSESLLLGNPDGARFKLANPTPNRFLIERPQYTVSYIDATKTPNWLSWVLNSNWLGNSPRQDNFQQDTNLPFADQVPADTFPSITFRDGSTSVTDRGHLAPNDDRTGTRKDQDATFLLTNMVPQNLSFNRGVLEVAGNLHPRLG